MTDLEITKLCAEAMKLKVMGLPVDNSESCIMVLAYGLDERYDPIYDDAQAMALVKKFPNETTSAIQEAVADSVQKFIAARKKEWKKGIPETDINRAICEAIAEMQLAKVKA